MLRLDLRHYETIVAIVDHGTMTAAAKVLSTTQSALSHRVADAERRLGVLLFERDRQRRLRPTQAAMTLHQSATRALRSLERSEGQLVASDTGVTSTVRVGVGSYESFHWYPGLVAAAATSHPEIRLELVSVGDSPGPALANDRVDVVLAPGRPAGDIDVAQLFEDELVCIVAPEHRFAGRQWITPDDLGDEHYYTYNLTPTPGFEFDRFVRPSGVFPRLTTVVPNSSAIIEVVAAGAGVSILSRWALTAVIDAGRLVPVRCGVDGLALPWVRGVRRVEPDDSPARAIGRLLANPGLLGGGPLRS